MQRMFFSLSVSRVYLVIFKSVSSYVNDIKCASASADCVTLCHSATVINIRIFDLKPLPTFLHNVIMHISKKKMSGLLSLSSSELEITITTIPTGPFVVILSQIKELVIGIL